MIKRRLSYANVTATLALVLALGTGGAYAIDRIGSGAIRDNSIRSADLRDGRAVRGADVKRNALGGRQVRESSLAASGIVAISGSEPGSCNPETDAFVQCATTTIRLRQRARVLGVGTGGQRSENTAAKAECAIHVDDVPQGLSANPGEETTDNTSGSATNGFARTIVTEPLSVGVHEVALACNQNGSADVRIQAPTIAAIAVGAR